MRVILILLAFFSIHSFAAVTTDVDIDGVLDVSDNCVNIANPAQMDGDNDGYGNMCDADFDNNGIVNTSDYLFFRRAFGTANSVADLNDSGGPVNTADYLIFRRLFGLPPGLSAVAHDFDRDGVLTASDYNAMALWVIDTLNGHIRAETQGMRGDLNFLSGTVFGATYWIDGDDLGKEQCQLIRWAVLTFNGNPACLAP